MDRFDSEYRSEIHIVNLDPSYQGLGLPYDVAFDVDLHYPDYPSSAPAQNLPCIYLTIKSGDTVISEGLIMPGANSFSLPSGCDKITFFSEVARLNPEVPFKHSEYSKEFSKRTELAVVTFDFLGNGSKLNGFETPRAYRIRNRYLANSPTGFSKGAMFDTPPTATLYYPWEDQYRALEAKVLNETGLPIEPMEGDKITCVVTHEFELSSKVASYDGCYFIFTPQNLRRLGPMGDVEQYYYDSLPEKVTGPGYSYGRFYPEMDYSNADTLFLDHPFFFARYAMVEYLSAFNGVWSPAAGFRLEDIEGRLKSDIPYLNMLMSNPLIPMSDPEEQIIRAWVPFETTKIRITIKPDIIAFHEAVTNSPGNIGAYFDYLIFSPRNRADKTARQFPQMSVNGFTVPQSSLKLSPDSSLSVPGFVTAPMNLSNSKRFAIVTSNNQPLRPTDEVLNAIRVMP